MAAAVEQFTAVFTQMGGLMAERVTDLRDIERRVVAHLVGEPEPGVQLPDEPSSCSPRTSRRPTPPTLDPRVVLALVTERGGPTSHTAIISRQLGIPCVVGTAGVHGDRGGHPAARRRRRPARSRPRPTPTRPRAGSRQDKAQRAALATWSGPGETADGTRIKILANVADGESARAAAGGPVEGVGLFRTELCFLNRVDEPSAEEQTAIYAAVLAPFAGRYVVVRTLDAGSDKPVAFATHEGEENPALGVRGLRLSFDNPGLLSRQLDGIAGGRPRDRHRDLGDGADGRHRGRGGRLRGAVRSAGSSPA